MGCVHGTLTYSVRDHVRAGVVYLKTSRVQELVALAKAAYVNSTFQALIGGVNDVQIFGLLMSRMSAVGWFAVGCRGTNGGKGEGDLPTDTAGWQADAATYDAHDYQYCPSEATSNPSVSPFNLLEYITHLKNHVSAAADPSVSEM